MLSKLVDSFISVKKEIFEKPKYGAFCLEKLKGFKASIFQERFPEKSNKFVSSPKFTLNDIGYTLNDLSETFATKLKINAISINPTIDEKIQFANAAFANEQALLNSIKIFYGSKDNKITANNHLMEDHVQYWLKLIVRAHEKGAKTAFSEVFAFQHKNNAIDISNKNDFTDKLVMPVISADHWKFFYYNFNNKRNFNYYNPLYDPEGPYEPSKFHESVAKEVIQRADSDNDTECHCQCPILPKAIMQIGNDYECGVHICVKIEAIVEEKTFEDLATNFDIKNERKRMQAVFEFIERHGTFPSDLFFNYPRTGPVNGSDILKRNNDKITATKKNKDVTKKDNAGKCNEKLLKDALRKRLSRGKMTAEEKAAQKERDRQRKNDKTESEKAEERKKQKQQKEVYRNSLTKEQRAKEKAQTRLRVRRIRNLRKQKGQSTTEAEKQKHAAAQRKYISRLQQDNYDGFQTQIRIKRILKLMDTLKNDEKSKKLNEEVEKYKLLTPNQYVNIRQMFCRQKKYGNAAPSILYKYRKLKNVRRHLKAVSEVNNFINNMLERKDSAINLSKYAELGILLNIRENKRPENEEEEMLQLSRAQYIFKKIKSMEEIAKEALNGALKKLHQQVNAKIKDVEGESADDYIVRVIGRISYHLKKPKESDEGFESLDDFFPGFYNQFMGVTECEKQVNDDDQNNIEVHDNLSLNNNGNYDENPNLPTDADNIIEVVQEIAERASETADKDMSSAIKNAIEEEVLDDKELLENAGPLAGTLLKIITKVKPCCPKTCPKFTAAQAKAIQNTFKHLCSLSGNELFQAIDNVMQENHADFSSTIHEGLKLFAPCKTGIRTILRRFNEIESYAYFLQRVKAAFESCNYEELCKIGNYENVPRSIMLTNTAVHFDSSEELTQDNAYKKFGKNIAAFRKAISENEVESCCICNQLNFPSNLCKLNFTDAQMFLTETQKDNYMVDAENFKGCVKCRKDIRNKTMPSGAVANGFDVDPLLEIEQKLNWVERSLCQLVRPVQSIICLKDVMNRRTNIKGKTGALVILPVPTTNTIDHLVNTLPSAEGLTIMVNTTVGKTLVRLPLVIEYLTYLKANNKLYENIEINEKFSFDGENNLIFDKPPTAEQIQNLITNNNNDPHLLSQREIEVQPVGNVDDEAPDGTAYDQYALLKNPYSPVNINSKDIDAMAYSGLHVNGNYGMHHNRKKKVTERIYVRNRLRSSDRRFATNANWLCFQQGRLEMKDINSSIATQARMNRTDLNGENFQKLLNEKDEVLQQCMSTQFSSLRGHKAYWSKVKLDLKAHIALFGPPSWFLTLNPAESDWEQVIDMYNARYNGNVSKSNIRTYIALDPYLWCRHFQHRIRSFFKNCLLTENSPLGEITNYFYRIEYQHRGTEHVHCLLWVKDAPKPGDDEENIIKYIDSHVTARIPDPVTEEELHNLVKKHQMHYKNCSPTCRRIFKSKGKTYTRCRFEFPRPAVGRTRINKTISPLLGYVGGKTKYYSVKRKEGDEQYVNEYSPQLLLAWQGNMDLQFLSADLLDIVNYVTGYTTKGESAKSESLFDSMKGTHISNKDKFRIYTSILKQREMGVMEIVDLLMGHEMYRFNSGHVFINTNAENKRHRILKPKNRIKKDEPAFEMNWYDNYFPGRPELFENFSLFNMMINFKVTNTKDKVDEDNDEIINDNYESDDEEYEEENSPKNIGKKNPFQNVFHTSDIYSPFYGHGKRKGGITFKAFKNKVLNKQRAQVPRLYWPKLEANNAEAREDYFRRLIMLFIPWREEDKLKGAYDSFEERWEAFMEELQKISENAFNDIKKIIRNQTMQLEMDQAVIDKRKEFRKAMRLAKIDEEPEDELEVYNREVNADKHKEAKLRLNDGQKVIFDEIVEHIQNRQLDAELDSLKLFITGTAGTGKSFLINLIADELTLNYTDESTKSKRPAVVIAAPTGLAAIQIKGSTIHSLFNIGVQHGRESKMSTISKDKLNLKRMLFSNLKLIIIDEISMVSNILLAKLHLRLTQFKNNDLPFGGVDIIVLGDLLQLSPVQAPEIFEDLLSYQVKYIFDSSISNFTFWELFNYRELTENMRQKESLEFAELLGRMRIEGLTQADHEMLRKRIITTPTGALPSLTQVSQKYVDIRQSDPTVMALFSTQDEITIFNKEVTKLLDLNTVLIEAEDTEIRTKKNSVEAKTTRIYQKSEYSLVGSKTLRSQKKSRFTREQTETIEKNDQRASAGLAKKLYLAENCPVMLLRNVNPSIGLVNGATGVLERIEYAHNTPYRLHIKFDNIDEVQIIDKASAIFDVNIEDQCCRRQFPVLMAFAATIHKAQGLTLKNVIISMESIFAEGQAFVAFSRVVSLAGLHLADYYANKIYVKKSCLIHYNHLRKQIGLPEYSLPPPKKKSTDVDEEKTKKNNSRKRKNQGNVLMVPHPIKKKKPNNDTNEATMEIDLTYDAQITDLNGIPLMQLNNTGSDCFLIAPLNFLHRIPSFVAHLTSGEYDGNPMANEIGNLYRNYALFDQVVRIRRLLPSRFREGFKDAFAAFEAITDAIIGEMFSETVIEFSITKRCENNTVVQRHSSRFIVLPVNDRIIPASNSRSLSFEAFFNIWSNSTEICSCCNATRFISKQLYNPENQSLKYIIINVEGFRTLPNGGYEMNNLTVTGLNNEVTMFGFRWLLISAVEFVNGNHYVTWVKGNGHWKIIDDSTITQRSLIKRNICCYKLLLFQRVEDC